MSDFRYVVEIRVSAARVWATLLDVERWPNWTASVTRIQRLDIAPLTIGSRLRIWQPRLKTAVWKVTSFDESRRLFVWTTRNPGITVVGSHGVDAIENGSRVTLSIQFFGLLSPLLGRLYGNLTQTYLAMEGTGLKNFCESLPSSEPARGAIAYNEQDITDRRPA